MATLKIAYAIDTDPETDDFMIARDYALVEGVDFHGITEGHIEITVANRATAQSLVDRLEIEA
jgi:hypothetical protein